MRGMRHRERLLKVLDTLDRHSDPGHRLSITQMLEALGLPPTESCRRDVRLDIRALREAGFPIGSERHRAHEYFFAERRFTTEELWLILDMVQGAPFLTEETAARLSSTIVSMGSLSEGEALGAAIRPTERVHMQNDDVFRSLSVIRAAIAARPRHLLAFTYFDNTPDKQRFYHHDGKPIRETPLALTLEGGYYYVICLNGEGHRRTRRVDRMERLIDTLLPSPHPRGALAFDFSAYERSHFGMFLTGEPQYVTLGLDAERERNAMNVLVDKFGTDVDVHPSPDGGWEARVEVCPSRMFFGWLASMSDLFELRGPEVIRGEYLGFLRHIVERADAAGM